jgi:hypothetical protein
MSINFILIIFAGLSLLMTLLFTAGIWTSIVLVFIALFLIISMAYADSAILFFLGARGLKRADEAKFHHASAQEAYKLAVPAPRLYFYNGTLDRAFVLEGRGEISLVLSKDLLENCNLEEISAICFALLLQVKKNLVKKRNKTLFLIGLISWISSAVIEILSKLFRHKHLKLSLNWMSAYLLRPWLEIIYKISIGEKYFQKIKKNLSEYPAEASHLMRAAGKIYRPDELDSFSSKKIWEYSSLGKNANFQRIISLELLPHEWDFIFKPETKTSV